MEKSFTIPFESKSLNVKQLYPEVPKANILLAHGAGASMDHVFMEKLALALYVLGFTVVRFNFPYMQEGKKFTGSPIRNIAAWHTVLKWAIQSLNGPIYLAGKSYGGRMASHLAAENPQAEIKGLIYFGFPLHAPGKPSVDRAAHLSLVTCPQLFLQGQSDSLASIELMKDLVSSLSNSTLIEFESADHSFKIKGKKLDDTITYLAEQTKSWIDG